MYALIGELVWIHVLCISWRCVLDAADLWLSRMFLLLYAMLPSIVRIWFTASSLYSSSSRLLFVSADSRSSFHTSLFPILCELLLMGQYGSFGWGTLGELPRKEYLLMDRTTKLYACGECLLHSLGILLLFLYQLYTRYSCCKNV
jgi:hypothetical protein